MKSILALVLAVVVVSTCGISGSQSSHQISKPVAYASKPAAKPAPQQSPVEPPPVAVPDAPAVVPCGNPCVPVGAIVGVITPNMGPAWEGFLETAKKDHAVSIVLGIASPGGDFNTSEEIFNLIKESEIPVYCYVKKAAMSGAFWILQACTERIAESDARLMTHSPYMMTSDGQVLNRTVLTKLLSQLSMMESVMAESIASRMLMTPDELVKRLQAGDWFMSAPQAVAAHSLDRFVPPGVQSFDAYIDSIKARAKR